MTDWLLLVLVVLTVHRLTRLIVTDSLPLIAKPRDAVQNYFGAYLGPELIRVKRLGVVGWSIAYALSCGWCMSVYVATAVVFLVGGWTSVPLPWLWVAAASTVTGYLMGVVEAEHEVRYQRISAEIDHLRSRR